MFVMPPTDPWRSFHIQAIHSKEKIQHFSASHVFSLAVSIFSASSPIMLREVVPRNVVLHTDGRLFAHYILDVLNVCLTKRRVPSDLWPKLQCIAELLILWFFPDSHISHRTCAHLEVLMAVVFASRAILWLRTHHWTEQAKRVLRVLPPEECTVLKFGIGSNVETNTSCLQRIVDRQRHLIDGPPLVFGLYQWWSVSWRYVGIGKHQRKMHPNQGGLSRRFLEHMCGTIRSRYRESFKLRYRLSRRSAPWSSFFMVCLTGSEAWVRACEYVECKVHQPCSNGTPPDPKSRRNKHRSRPTKQLRRPCMHQGSLVTETCIEKRYCTELRRVASRAVSAGRETPGCDFWCLSYTQAYILCLKSWFVKTGEQGPLDIYTPFHRRLLLLYLGLKTCVVNIAVAKRRDAFMALKCAIRLRCLKGPGQRVNARRHLDDWLKLDGFAVTRIHYLKLPHVSLLPYARRVMSHMLRHLPSMTELEKKWVASRMRFCTGKTRTFKDEWNHAKLCKAPGPWPHTDPSIPQRIPGHVARVDKNWQVAQRMPKAEQLDLCRTLVSETLGSMISQNMSCFQNNSCAPHVSVPRVVRQHWQSQDRSHLAFLRYTNDLLIPEGTAVVPDDKAKKVAWKMPVASYLLLCMSFASASVTWERCTVSQAEANQWLCMFVMSVLGVKLAKRLHISKSSFLLPYVYVTIKEKCWRQAQRVCSKPLHSCVRKVVSYANWQRKRVWRSIHRAWETILKQCGKTNDVWSLHDASKRLKEDLKNLSPNPSGVCARCKCPMSGCAGIVADAGQFFETVNPATAIEEACTLVDLFKSIHGEAPISVRSSKKRIGWIGGKKLLHTHKGVSWHTSHLLRAFVAAMSVGFASVGTTVFMLNGLPIGGLLSKVAACLTLGGQERRWSQNAPRRFEEGFCTHVPWNRAVCHLRYTDDVVLFSRLFCRNCLIALLTCVYTVDFDVSEANDTLAWLDMCIYTVSLEVGLNIKPFCAPPHWGVPKSFLRNLFLGKFSRWWNIRPPENDWKRACLRLLFDLRLASWPRSAILSTLFSIAHLDFLHMVSFSKTACKFVWANCTPQRAA